jgi:hypothetical protein
MPDATSNIEFAHKIHEHGHHRPPNHRRAKWIEMAEAIVLATVAVATAWSGYQAARWDALSAENYQRASRTSVESQGKVTLAGQDRLYDIVTFNGWVGAKMAGHATLASYYERRFRPEYATAFAAWQKLDPFNNAAAPPGPIFMPEYASANAQQAAQLEKQAEGHFDMGVHTRHVGDQYVKVTVLLATVLLLTALSQRFENVAPRIAVVAVAWVLLIVSIYSIVTFPRA